MRRGPGVSYPIVVPIPAGSTGITVNGCRSSLDGTTRSWCAARWRSYAGWVSSCCVVNENGALPSFN